MTPRPKVGESIVPIRRQCQYAKSCTSDGLVGFRVKSVWGLWLLGREDAGEF
jgi:hypothetical protein